MATIETIHREMYDAWNRRDFEAIRALLHPGYTYTGGDGKEMTGGPDMGIAVAQMYAAAFPDGKIELKQISIAGDLSVTEFVARGTHGGPLMDIPPTGRPVAIHVCNVVEVRDGKIYREREYMDMLSMLTQLGVAGGAHAAAA